LNSNTNHISGKTDAEVLAGIASGEIHPNSQIVAQHGLAPQTIFEHLPRPSCMVGCLGKIQPDIWAQLWPEDPYPQDE